MFSGIFPPFSLGSDLLSHVHLEAFNAFAEISFSALELTAPNIHIFASALYNDWPVNPLQLTSMGSSFILQALRAGIAQPIPGIWIFSSHSL